MSSGTSENDNILPAEVERHQVTRYLDTLMNHYEKYGMESMKSWAVTEIALYKNRKMVGHEFVVTMIEDRSKSRSTVAYLSFERYNNGDASGGSSTQEGSVKFSKDVRAASSDDNSSSHILDALLCNEACDTVRRLRCPPDADSECVGRPVKPSTSFYLWEAVVLAKTVHEEMGLEYKLGTGNCYVFAGTAFQMFQHLFPPQDPYDAWLTTGHGQDRRHTKGRAGMFGRVSVFAGEKIDITPHIKKYDANRKEFQGEVERLVNQRAQDAADLAKYRAMQQAPGAPPMNAM